MLCGSTNKKTKKIIHVYRKKIGDIFQSSVWTTWRGRVVAIVQPSGVGTIVVQARGLEGVVEEVTIQVV